MLFSECVFWTRVSWPRGDKCPVVVIDNKDGKNKFSCFSKKCENTFSHPCPPFQKISSKANGEIIFQKIGEDKKYWKIMGL